MTLTFSRLGDFGRFGNQLFQIASTIGLALKNGHDFEFPLWDYQHLFLHSLPLANYENKKYDILLEKTTKYSDYSDKIKENKNYDLIGYFQSYKYFDEYRKDIEYYFTLKSEWIFNIENSVSIHVRRTDYLSLQHVHPVLDIDYYFKAIEVFPKDFNFYVFSDDIDWCKENFPSHFNFINNSIIKDFSYMKNCKHNIIANSSFSWWAAYLNSNKDKIIVAPKVYVLNEDNVDDRIPEGWIRI